MDMPLPRRIERLDYTLHALKDVLIKHGNITEVSCIDDLLSSNSSMTKESKLNAIMHTNLKPHNTNKNKKQKDDDDEDEGTYIVTATTPETDRPSEDDDDNITGDIHNNSNNTATLEYVRNNIEVLFSTDDFEVMLCLKVLLCLTDGWSYRDMKQFLQSINYAIMCSDHCRLTSYSWAKELIYAFD